MIVIDAGEFTGPIGVCPGESVEPEFIVGTLFQDEFSIDRRPVTCEDFERCVSAQVCRRPGIWDNPSCHVGLATVSRSNAKAYFEWRQAELPSISQWHRAALGVNATDLERSVPRCLPKPRSADPFDHGDPEIPRCEQIGPSPGGGDGTWICHQRGACTAGSSANSECSSVVPLRPKPITKTGRSICSCEIAAMRLRSPLSLRRVTRICWTCRRIAFVSSDVYGPRALIQSTNFPSLATSAGSSIP